MKPLHRSQCKKMMAGRRTISRETYFTRSEYASKYWSILYFEMFINKRKGLMVNSSPAAISGCNFRASH